MDNIQPHRLFLFGSLAVEPLKEELEIAEQEAQLFEKISQISPDQNLTEQVTELLEQIATVENHRRTMYPAYGGLEPIYIQALYTHIQQQAYLNDEIASHFASLKNELHKNLNQISKIWNNVCDTSYSLENKSRPANQFLDDLCSLIIFCNKRTSFWRAQTKFLPSLNEIEKLLINSSWVSMGSPKKEIPWSKAERTIYSLYVFKNILLTDTFDNIDLSIHGFCSSGYSATKQKKFLDSKIEYIKEFSIGNLYAKLLSEAGCTQLSIIQNTGFWDFYIPTLKQAIFSYKHLKVQDPKAFEPALIEFTQNFARYWPYLSQICSTFSQESDTHENLLMKKQKDSLTFRQLMEKPLRAALAEMLEPLYFRCKEEQFAQDLSPASFRPNPHCSKT